MWDLSAGRGGEGSNLEQKVWGQGSGPFHDQWKIWESWGWEEGILRTPFSSPPPPSHPDP